MNDKEWLTLEAICKLLYSRFDFNDGIAFTIGELKRAVNKYGPVKAKVSGGNEFGINWRIKAMKINLVTFVLLSSSKDSQPEESTKGRAWTQASEESQEIVDSVSQMIQIYIYNSERSASPETLSQANHCKVNLTPMPGS
jgi:hypothetical protein